MSRENMQCRNEAHILHPFPPSPATSTTDGTPTGSGTRGYVAQTGIRAGLKQITEQSQRTWPLTGVISAAPCLPQNYKDPGSSTRQALRH